MSADTVAETQVWVDHEVYFHLRGNDQFVVARRGTRGFALVDWITVHVPASRHPWLSAGGTVCRKDGTFSEHWGRSSESVDLPDAAAWIEKALAHIDRSPEGRSGQEDVALRRGGATAASPGLQCRCEVTFHDPGCPALEGA